VRSRSPWPGSGKEMRCALRSRHALRRVRARRVLSQPAARGRRRSITESRSPSVCGAPPMAARNLRHASLSHARGAARREGKDPLRRWRARKVCEWPTRAVGIALKDGGQHTSKVTPRPADSVTPSSSVHRPNAGGRILRVSTDRSSASMRRPAFAPMISNATLGSKIRQFDEIAAGFAGDGEPCPNMRRRMRLVLRGGEPSATRGAG
jgi:hypothetical protein